MKLSLGFSPCPNDTFIFDALVNQKIDTGSFEFDVVLEDVETLNQWAKQGRLDITKLSFPAYFQTLQTYSLLNAGSALGKGVGPILISTSEHTIKSGDLEKMSIAIPGIHTTANLLLSFAFPNAKNKIPMIFSEIEDAVLSGKTDLGVIIHENRFTYQDKGLHEVIDLGEYWEEKMHLPIPLGGIAMKKQFGQDIIDKVNQLIKTSLSYAFDHYPVISDYVKQNAQEMSEDVMRQHISLYVNDFSVDLGEEGKNAIKILEKIYREMHSG